MPQTTLSTFVGANPPRCKLVRHAVNYAKFSSTAPSHTVLATVHIKLPSERICLEIYDQCDLSADAFVPNPQCLDTALLVSNLQKTVRRGMHEKAAITAWELAHCDLIALVRRLPIIAIEDVRSDAHFPLLVWLLVAVSSKKYTPTTTDVHLLVAYTEALARHQDRIVVHSDIPSQLCRYWSSADARKDNVALAMLVRVGYGGMAGDMNMLLHAASQDNTTAPQMPLQLRSAPHRVTRETILLDAIDFHVDSSLIDKVYDEHASPEQIKAAIWHCASKHNIRQKDMPTTVELRDIFARILPQLSIIRARRLHASIA